ncbi:MAG: hypothetical protein GPJ54_20175 [Candidatus Heimdallarchaeota archaeon]|nr:hypothetical protein [Candidatus Heimdallarchaeota archaeon]
MKNAPRSEDNFAKTAISFLLGVIVGFSLFLMGLVFFMIALLANKSEESELEGYVWIIFGIISMIIGIFMMRRNLGSAPAPGAYK